MVTSTALGFESNCSSIHFSRHAMERMFQRGFSPAMALEALRSGEIIASYSDDIPYPSHLLLSHAHGNPVHVVVA